MVLGIAGDERASAEARYQLALRHRFRRVIGPLHVQIRPERGEQPRRGRLGEEHHPVDATKRVDELGALLLRHDRTGRPLHAADGSVRVHPHDPDAAPARLLPEGLRFSQRADHLRPREAARGCTASVGCATSARASSASISAAETGTVPGFCTLRAPATLAMRIAWIGSPPAAMAAVQAAMTVSPAPVTSTASAEPCTGTVAVGAPGRGIAMRFRRRWPG